MSKFEHFSIENRVRNSPITHPVISLVYVKYMTNFNYFEMFQAENLLDSTLSRIKYNPSTH